MNMMEVTPLVLTCLSLVGCGIKLLIAWEATMLVVAVRKWIVSKTA